MKLTRNGLTDALLPPLSVLRGIDSRKSPESHKKRSDNCSENPMHVCGHNQQSFLISRGSRVCAFRMVLPISERMAGMGGMDFLDHLQAHVCEAGHFKSMAMGQSAEAPDRDRRRAWTREASKSSTVDPQQTTIPLSTMSTGSKIPTEKKSATGRDSAPKTATTIWTKMQPAKRVDP